MEEAYARILRLLRERILCASGQWNRCRWKPQKVPLNAASSLYFESKIYGASRNIEITTDNPELAKKLGVDGATITQGKDAVMALDTTSGFSKTATTFVEGNRVTVSDRGGFEICLRCSRGRGRNRRRCDGT